MVAQECPPSLRRRPSAADHVFGNRRLDDLLLGMTHSRPTRYSIRRIHHYHSIAALGSKDPTAHPFPDCKNARASWHSAIERLFEVTEQCDRIALYSRKGFSYRARHRWQPKGTASRKSPYSFRIRGRSRPRARRRGCALSLGRWLAAMACALAGLGWGLLGRTCFM